jgi:hypothetical protein
MKITRFSGPDHVQVPPAELLAQLPDPIAQAASETADLRERYKQATRDLYESEHQRDAARIADAEAAAVALRAKKPAPKPTLPKAEEKVRKMAADLEALGLAALGAGSDLDAAIQAHRADAEGALSEARNQQRALCHARAIALSEAVADGGETQALLSWIRQPTHGANPGTHGHRETRLRGPDGSPLSVRHLVSELTSAWLDGDSLPPALPKMPSQKVATR